jgi:hypothetical protein
MHAERQSAAIRARVAEKGYAEGGALTRLDQVLSLCPACKSELSRIARTRKDMGGWAYG